MAKARLGHVALDAQDPVALAAFYRDLFGMEIVGQHPQGVNAFVGGLPVEEENHELAFMRNRNGAHIGLRVETLADLQAFYQEVKARGIPIAFMFNHGFALAMYFADPEGNLIEVYWPTGRDDYRPPYVEPLDLSRPEEELRQMVASMSRQTEKRSATEFSA